MSNPSPIRIGLARGGTSVAFCLVIGALAVLLLREPDTAARYTTAVATAGADLPGRAPERAAPVPAAIPPAPSATAAQATEAPTFDVIRVAPSGSAVLAGRAAPNADVTVTDGQRELGRAQADGRGEWVLLPSAPLAPGGRELSLASRTPSGADVKGEAPVVLVVPERGASPSQSVPLAVIVPPNAAPQVLLAPPGAASEPAQAASPPAANTPALNVPPAARPTGRLGLDVVDYGDTGDLRLGGSAVPGAPVRVYVDNAPVGDTQADPQGRWALTPREAMLPGVHQVRVDQLTAQGKVAARVELPVQRDVLPPGTVPEGRVVVQPGQNLWRLARNSYGSGIRYTIIFQANREHIRDPRLIYPGQAFTVPAL